MVLGRALQAFRRKVQRDINYVAYQACRRASVRIVNDLKSQGPYYEGLFELAWEVRAGNVDIPADQQPSAIRRRDPRSSYAPRQPISPITINEIPDQRVAYNRVPSLTIGNRMAYRDIALDLKPGRIKGGGGETAPQDWYITYYGGGGLDKALRFASKGRLRLPGD